MPNIDLKFLGFIFALFVVLFVRVAYGLDLTDEMQYYGEIKGLLETGRLFSNDLFVQQTVYVVLYPAFYFYHLIFGFDGLLVFGRLLLAAIIVITFFYSYKKLIGFGFSVGLSSAVAFALTFAIPYHGIFAPSYNTVAQVLWVIYLLKFYEWKTDIVFPFYIAAALAVLVHPTSGAIMFFLVLLRLFSELRIGFAFKYAIKSGLAVATAILVAFCFASPMEYLAALEFSSGFGVGAAFFSSTRDPFAMVMICLSFGMCLLLWRRIKVGYFPLVVSAIAVSIAIFATGKAGGAYTHGVVYVLSLLGVLAYLWVLSNTPRGGIDLRGKIDWFVVALLVYASTLAVTSGNGLPQATGAFMVGVPLLFGFALHSCSSETEGVGHSRKVPIVSLMIVVLFLVHWAKYPYREYNFWNANASISSVSEFKYIKTSESRARFIYSMQTALSPYVQGRHVLIVSEYPALYFVLGGYSETCMLYMHSLPPGKAEKVFRGCMEYKNPEVVIDVFEANSYSGVDSHVKRVLGDYYLSRGYTCRDDAVDFGMSLRHQFNIRYCYINDIHLGGAL